MAISKKIQKYLEEKKYKYNIIDHKKTFTAWDTAQTEKIDPKMVAKALVMKADNNYVLALIPGNRNLDKQKLLKLINAQRKKQGLKNSKKIDFAKEVWMKKNLEGKVGATPPFRGLIKLDIFADSLLLKNKKIYTGSGEYTESILINTSEYIKKEEVVKGSFSKKK
ncbi:MAG TPA: YbaK/EbsC family protein [Candidatus Moranbacteria bacterium]|nr:YbaK/EbsC family protein [Candidatus Moranbacteria bacterium]